MATFCDRFRSYYLTTEEHFYTAWELEHTPLSGDIEQKKVNIEESARNYLVPRSIQSTLEQMITAEVHGQMVAGNFDPGFYEARGFTVLKSERGTLVLGHDDLPGYLIKTAIKARDFFMGTIPERVEKVQIAHANLLRAEGRAYYEAHSEDRRMFSFPKEYLYESPYAKAMDPLHHRFFAISEKVEIYSAKESVELVQRLAPDRQLEIAQKVCDFIKQTGMCDMHNENLLVRKDLQNWTFSLIDLEPLGLFVEQSDDTNTLAPEAELALLGLVNFRDHYCRRHQLTDMAHYVDEQIELFVTLHSELKGKDINGRNLFADGFWRDEVQHFGGISILLILLTIPFFYIVLPILAIRAACSAPLHEQLA